MAGFGCIAVSQRSIAVAKSEASDLTETSVGDNSKQQKRRLGSDDRRNKLFSAWWHGNVVPGSEIMLLSEFRRQVVYFAESQLDESFNEITRTQTVLLRLAESRGARRAIDGRTEISAVQFVVGWGKREYEFAAGLQS